MSSGPMSRKPATGRPLTTRRHVLKTLAGGALSVMPPLAPLRRASSLAWPDAAAQSDPWSELPAILARITPPSFRARAFDVTTFGAIGDGRIDNTDAFRAAIAACHAAGGGHVVVPAGTFVSGAIELKSGVDLHLAERATTIRFTRDLTKYPVVLTRFEGMECMNFSPLVYAFEQERIAITGRGTLDGNADCEHWWPWKGRTTCGWRAGQPNQDADRNALLAMVERGTPVHDRRFGGGHYLRPQFIEPYRSRSILIEGVTLRNAPMWQVHPVLCTNVTVQNVSMVADGPNTDGADPESCRDVLIRDCSFDTGDDCIAIKSGRNADGRRLNAPSENIIIQGCRMKNGHGGITIGSEISGGVRNVFAENCRLDSPDLDFAVRIKTNAMRGGIIEQVFVRNLEVGQVARAAITVDFYYEEAEKGPFTPVVRHITIEGVKSRKAAYALYLRGFERAPIRDVLLVDCDFEGVVKGSLIEHVSDLVVRDVRINGTRVDHVP
jgi:polygalacturonase